MKRRTIDTMREVRLWVGQIVVPAITLAATSMAIPEVRQAVAAKASQWKRSIENKVKKNEESLLGSLFYICRTQVTIFIVKLIV